MVAEDCQAHVRSVGSHRIYGHRDKPGIVVVPGNLGKDLAPGTLASIWRQAGLERQS
jgi:predicted RNA binding protein YcfA (HicA-like mRNA interferase family)